MAAEASQRNQEYRKQLQAVLAQGRRGDAVELFMRLAGSSDESIADARSSPYWPGLEALAPTLAYAEFFELAADAIIAAIPIPERVVREGQGHVATRRRSRLCSNGFSMSDIAGCRSRDARVELELDWLAAESAGMPTMPGCPAA